MRSLSFKFRSRKPVLILKVSMSWELHLNSNVAKCCKRFEYFLTKLRIYRSKMNLIICANPRNGFAKIGGKMSYMCSKQWQQRT